MLIFTNKGWEIEPQQGEQSPEQTVTFIKPASPDSPGISYSVHMLLIDRDSTC